MRFLLVIPALLLLVVPGAAEAKHKKSCAPRGAKVVVTSPTGARVLTDATDDAPGTLLCLSKTAKAIRLDDGNCDEARGAAGQFTVAGDYLAYVFSRCGISGDNSSTVKVVNVRQRKLVATSAGTSLTPTMAGTDVFKLLLDPSGAVAWAGGPIGTDQERQVFAMRPGTATCPLGSQGATAPSCLPDAQSKPLDTGAIDPASLALTATTVSWNNGGQAKSAPLS
jgi:hypothetical protein